MPDRVRALRSVSWNGPANRRGRVRKVLLVCGIFASLHYVAMNVLVPMRWEGYSVAAQTVSELSAIGAPTRTLWVLLGTVFTLLYTAFGLGVLASVRRNRALRVVGGLIVAHAILSLFWPPMNLRGTPPTLTDTLHIVWTIATGLLMTAAVGFSAAPLGKGFRLFAVATLVIMVGFGVLTGLDGPRIAANLPTPWVGIWERITIAAFCAWLVVLAVVLLRDEAERSPDRLAGSRDAV